MALKLVRRPWGRQPIGAAGINWGHPRAEGLAFFAPLSGAHGTRDLVQEQLGVRTGLEEYVPAQNGAIYHRFFSANRADFPLLPLGIGLNTPFTLAWTQEPRSGSAYSALLVVNFGTAGTDHQFTIYQSTSDASYSMVTGPLGAGSSASNTPRFSGIGVATNERLDRFVLQCSGGSQSVTTGDYVLWRNGERFTTSATAVLSAYRTAAFRIGALSDAGDPFEGLIGDMRMWSRVLSDGEAEEESTVHGSWALFEPQRIWVPINATSGGGQTVAIAQASEADTAQAFFATVGSVTAIGQAMEANAAQALTTRQTKAVGQAIEADVAQAFAAAQRKAIGQATETDAAQALAASQRKAIGQSVEVDTAQPVAYSAPGVVGQATETDTAQPFAARQSRAIGQALESNAAQPITASTGTAVAIGLALEIDTAGAFAALGPIAIVIGQAQEADLARAMTSIGGGASIDPATIRRVARSPALARLARSPAMVRSTNGL